MPPVVREVIDLSVPVKSGTTRVYPGDPEPLRSLQATIAKDGFETFLWTLGDHTGTHVDSPAHFIAGATTIESLSITTYIGPGIVLDFTDAKAKYSISKADIIKKLDNRKLHAGSILLFHTGYTQKVFMDEWLEHPSLSEEAAHYIVELGVNAIGVDAASPDHSPFPVHKILLSHNVGIIENLANLGRALHRDFLFVGAPLTLVGGSGSPVRALALVF